MSGTKEGGLLAATANTAQYGADFYQRIGRIGGLKGKKDGAIKGFAANPELAKEAGRKGGTISRRGKSQIQPPAGSEGLFDGR